MDGSQLNTCTYANTSISFYSVQKVYVTNKNETEAFH